MISYMQYYKLPSKLGVMSRVGCNGKFWLRQVMVVGLLGIASMEESGVSVDLDLFSCRILQSLRRELGEKKKKKDMERREELPLFIESYMSC